MKSSWTICLVCIPILLAFTTQLPAKEEATTQKLSKLLASTCAELAGKPAGKEYVWARLAPLYKNAKDERAAKLLLAKSAKILDGTDDLFMSTRVKTALATALYDSKYTANGKRALTSALRNMTELSVKDILELYPEVPVERAETGRIVLLAKLTKTAFDASQVFGESLGCSIVEKFVRANRGEAGGRFLLLLRGIIKPAFGELAPHLVQVNKVPRLLVLMKEMDANSRAYSQAALVSAYVRAGESKKAQKFASEMTNKEAYFHLRAEIWLASVDQSREGLQRITDTISKIRSMKESMQKTFLLTEAGRALAPSLHWAVYDGLKGIQPLAIGATQRLVANKNWSKALNWTKLIKNPHLRLIYLLQVAQISKNKHKLVKMLNKNPEMAFIGSVIKSKTPLPPLPFDKDEAVIVEGKSPLRAFFRAVIKGDSRIVQKLLDKGVPPREVGPKGATALHHSSKRGYVHVTDVLIKNGANLNARTPSGKTALHLAAKAGRGGTLKLLVNGGAKLDLLDNKGYSALHYAIAGKYGKITRYLLKKGASAKAHGKGAPSLLEYAKEKGSSAKVTNLIRSHGGGN